MNTNHTRRSVVLAGLGSAASIALTGCASRGAATRNAGLPGPRWPHEGGFDDTPAPSTRPRPRPVATGTIRVQPRSTWTNTGPIVSQADPMVRVERLTVHHDALPPIAIRSRAQAADRIETIRRSHVQGRGWADIGYHYIVDPTGGVWEGRPIRLQGAHVRDQNPRNVGVLVLGHFDEQQPTPQALAALDATMAELCGLHGIPLGRVKTHQELASTGCPGSNLQRYMIQTRARHGRLAQRLMTT
ncbi:MAG: peptidoglycan recognition family protein [Planctomycetota bacterium]